MSTFWKRTLSGVVYVSLVIVSILVSPIFFGALFTLVTMLAVHEYHQLMGSSRYTMIGSTIASGFLFATAWCFSHFDTIDISSLAYMVSAYFLFLIFLLVIELWLKADDPTRNWGNILISHAMIAMPFASMNLILDQSKFLLLALFITIWINDTGAYCVGSLLAKRKSGNHKMFSRISPNKSWEGLIGGVFFVLIAGLVYYKIGWFNDLEWLGGCDWMSPEVKSLVAAILFSIVISIAGTIGDLMESLMKRTLGVKDSGCFMPGHGGVLDRFDSILLAAPALVLLILLF